MDPPIKNGEVGDWRLSDEDFLASFHLPGAADKYDRLKDLHPLPRDARILFNEEMHEYRIDGVKAPRSVTGLVHAYGWDFDAYAAVGAMKKGSRWPEKREAFLTDTGLEMEDAEIVELWKRRGNIASARGTLLHWHAEMHLNGRQLELPHSPEFEMFLAVVDVLRLHFGWRPYRTEISLFHCGLCLAGQADALFVDAGGDIVILDWKRTKSIRFDNAFRSLKEPLDHLPDSNGWLYNLQLNTYRYILESEYGMRVSGMYLAQVHPCLPRARLIEVPRMEEELELIVEDQIHHRGEAISGALPDARFALPERKGVAQIEPACACVSSPHLPWFYILSALLSLSLSPHVFFSARAPGSR